MASKEAKTGNVLENVYPPASNGTRNGGAVDVDAALQDQIAKLDITKVDQLATTITERLSGGLEGDFHIKGGAPVRNHRQGQMQEMFQLKQSVDTLLTAVTAVKKSHANKNKDHLDVKPARPNDTLLRAVMDKLDNLDTQMRDIRIKQDRLEEEASRTSRINEKQFLELTAQVEKLKKGRGKGTATPQHSERALGPNTQRQLDTLARKVQNLSVLQQVDREETFRKLEEQASLHERERQRGQAREEAWEGENFTGRVEALERSYAELSGMMIAGGWDTQAVQLEAEGNRWELAPPDGDVLLGSFWNTTYGYEDDDPTREPADSIDYAVCKNGFCLPRP